MSKSDSTPVLSPAEAKAISDLKRSQMKREKRLANSRIVYGYRVKGSDTILDNLLLLPAATKLAHKEFLRGLISQLPAENLKRFANVQIVRVGEFNVHSLSFQSETPIKFMFSCSEIKGLEND